MRFLCVLLLAALLRRRGAAAVCYAGSDPPNCGTCFGSCTSENGCFCADQMTSCIPTVECSLNSSECCPVGLFWNQTESCCSDELSCAPTCLDDELCVNETGIARCLCNNSSYLNKTRGDLMPLVTCDSSVMTFALSKCLVQSLGYDPSSFRLNINSDSCTNSYDTDIIGGQRMESMQVKVMEDWCGNTVTTSSTNLDYANTVHIAPYNLSGSSESALNFTFSCNYNISASNMSVSGSGSFAVAMEMFWDPGLSLQVQEDETLTVGTPLYLRLRTTSPHESSFMLRAERCFASPYNSTESSLQVQLLSGGCPANQGVYTEVLENGVSTQVKIMLSAFMFQGYTGVFVFCDVRLCDRTGPCTGCNVGRAAATRGSTARMGPLGITADNSYSSSSGSHTAVSWAVLAASLLGPLCTKLF